MCNIKGNIFNIQRFATSDGKGIRTVIFLKGCPLNCSWCHNPESKSKKTELFFYKELCFGCGKCSIICNNHFFDNNTHSVNRNSCSVCGKCAENCPSNALELCGKEKSVEEVIKTVLRDKPFYEQSGGGLTVSGGEPLLQYNFTLSLLRSAKNNGINTAIETCGFSDCDLAQLNQYTDQWLYDIKLFNETEHIKYTGVSNKKIFENLYFLDSINANIVLRCPIIPDVNLSDEHFDMIAELSNKLNNAKAIHLEPYHPLGISKSERLGKNQEYYNLEFTNKALIEPFSERLKQHTEKEIVII